MRCKIKAFFFVYSLQRFWLYLVLYIAYIEVLVLWEEKFWGIIWFYLIKVFCLRLNWESESNQNPWLEKYFSHKFQMLNVNHHRINKWFWLEMILKIISFQLPAMGRDSLHWIRLLRAPSSTALSTTRDGASTTFLDNLFQYLTTLSVKNLFPRSKLNLMAFGLKLFPLVLSYLPV